MGVVGGRRPRIAHKGKGLILIASEPMDQGGTGLVRGEVLGAHGVLFLVGVVYALEALGLADGALRDAIHGEVAKCATSSRSRAHLPLLQS